ncbi:MAG: glycosyltransferase family 39 protein [Chloroflexi bacterium]|nr:glycosyltransferase family 39 protein [Chloroflexota bacterium]
MKNAAANVRATESPDVGAWRWVAALGAILLVGLAVRLYRLDAQSIWYDEGWSIELAHEAPGRALVRLQEFADPHPPGYYLLLIAWGRLVGRSVWALRALSVVLGILTVLGLYDVGRRLFDRWTGLFAALFLSVAPAHVVYSQEMRMYTLLTACLAALLGLFYRYGVGERPWKAPHWAALIALEALALYTHFFAVFALAALNVWLAVRLILRAKREGLRPLLLWLASQGCVLLAYAPWLPVTLQRAATHTTLAQFSPALGPFFASSWSFLLGGHIALYDREPLYRACAFWALGGFSIGTLLLLIRDPKRGAVLYLIAQFALPMLGVYALMRLRPGYHPRYVLMVILPLIVLLARQVALIPRLAKGIWPLAALIAAIWLGAFTLAGHALVTDRYYDRDDARSTAAFLKEHLAPGSVVLMSHSEWALRYYLRESGLTDLYPIVDEDPEGAIQLVQTALRGRSQAALVWWGQADVDRRGLLPFLLERAGTLLSEHHLPGYTVFLYAIDEERPAVRSQRYDAHFGPLRLVEAEVQTWVPADEATTVAITWRKEGALSHDYKVALSLVDRAGRVLARRDQILRDARGRGTSLWPEGYEVTNYYALFIPPGTAPLEYELTVGVYHEGDLAGLDVLDIAGAPAGKTFSLGEIALTPALGRAPRRLVDRERLGLTAFRQAPLAAPGLALNAYRLERTQYRTGERLSVLLEWRHVGEEPLQDYWPALQLVYDRQVVASQEAAPVYDAYPTSQWAPGETVLDWRDLVVPPTLPDGEVTVQVAVRGEEPIVLGQVEVEAVPRIYSAPAMQHRAEMPLAQVGTLAGYDLSSTTVRAGGELILTLYWRASGPSVSEYVVFTHLLSKEGRLIAQHDAPPAGGERPTTGWVEGEYIVDRHTLQWVDTVYSGPAVIEVGLYDPLSGQRVKTPRGDSRLLLLDVITVE